MKQSVLGLVAASLLATAACSTSSDTTASSTTAPTAAATTENFSGTVQVGGNDSHPFTVTTSGAPITLTLTAVGPPATIFMGFGVGSWDGTTCTLVSGGFITTQAGTTPQLSGNINAGNFCLMVYDVGNMSAPVTYTATAAHY